MGSGAEVYSGATTEKQAWEVFGPAQIMAKRAEGFMEHYGVDGARQEHEPHRLRVQI